MTEPDSPIIPPTWVNPVIDPPPKIIRESPEKKVAFPRWVREVISSCLQPGEGNRSKGLRQYVWASSVGRRHSQGRLPRSRRAQQRVKAGSADPMVGVPGSEARP